MLVYGSSSGVSFYDFQEAIASLGDSVATLANKPLRLFKLMVDLLK